ncbi:hypothetical protein CAPN001_11610 [Capnocytophaga stomatis]|nr:hypothetical protein CAPN001_11610 [Capnocytophaga stomatis]
MKLKQAHQNEKKQFVDYVFNTFDPNFYSEEEAMANQATVYQFIEDCELTLNEMVKAITMVLNGKLLNDNSEPIMMMHKISLISLYEIKRAYIQHKISDFQHTKGLKMIAEATKPKPKEMTEEEKEILTLTSILQSFEDFKATGKLPVVNKWIYDELWKRGIMLDFAKSLTEQDKDLLRERTNPILKQRAESEPDKYRAVYQSFLKNIPTNEGVEISIKKEVTLAYFYENLIKQNVSLTEKLTEYQNKKQQNQ